MLLSKDSSHMRHVICGNVDLTSNQIKLSYIGTTFRFYTKMRQIRGTSVHKRSTETRTTKPGTGSQRFWKKKQERARIGNPFLKKESVIVDLWRLLDTTVIVVGQTFKMLNIKEENSVKKLWSPRANDRSYSSLKVLLHIKEINETIAVEILIWIVILTISNIEYRRDRSN